MSPLEFNVGRAGHLATSRGLRVLADLPSAKYEDLISRLRELPAAAAARSIARDFAGDGLTEADVGSVIVAAVSARQVETHFNFEPAMAVGYTIEAVLEADLEDEVGDRVAERLGELASLPVVQLREKLIHKVSETHVHLNSVATFTDLRAIFDPGGATGPEHVNGLAVTSTVVLEVLEPDNPFPRTIRLPLSGDDIRRLRDALTRDLEKRSSLTEFLRTREVPCLTTEDTQ